MQIAKSLISGTVLEKEGDTVMVAHSETEEMVEMRQELARTELECEELADGLTKESSMATLAMAKMSDLAAALTDQKSTVTHQKSDIACMPNLTFVCYVLLVYSVRVATGRKARIHKRVGSDGGRSQRREGAAHL